MTRRPPDPAPPLTSWGCERCAVTWRDAPGVCWVCGGPGVAAWIVTRDAPWAAAHTVEYRPGKTPITEVWHEQPF